MTITETHHTASPDAALTGKLYELYQSARKARSKRTDTWRKNYLLSMNRWGKSPDDPRDSEIYPILRARVAWMTDQEVNFGVDPAAEPNGPFYDFQVKLGEHLAALLHTNYKVGHWYSEIATMLWDAPIFGAGILKGVWDSGLDDGLGNVALRRVDPWTFYPDPNATSLDDAQYLVEVHRWSIDEVERRFPGVDHQRLVDAVAKGDRTEREMRPRSEDFPRMVRDGIPINLGQGPVSVGAPGQGTMSKNVLNQGVNVYEFWLRENVFEERESTDPHQPSPEPVVTDDWRVVVFTSDIVLLDETASDLWELNRHPYERYCDDEIGEFWGTPLVGHLLPLQLAINQLLSQILNNVLLTGNPVFLDVAGSGIERTPVINRPGQRMTMKSATAQNSGAGPRWLVPPQMPNTVMTALEFAISRMENIAGLSGVTKGQVPSGRQAAQTTQAVQESGFVSIRASLRNLEQTLAGAGELLAHLIILNYDIPRVVAILGDEGEPTALRLAAEHFYTPTEDGKEPLRFALVVNAGSSNPTSRQARIAEVDALRAMGAVDNQAVLEAHRFPHWPQVLQRMQAEAEAAAEQERLHGGPKGQPKGVGQGHAH